MHPQERQGARCPQQVRFVYPTGPGGTVLLHHPLQWFPGPDVRSQTWYHTPVHP